MGVVMKFDQRSEKELKKRFKILFNAYPTEIYKAMVSILFDMKLIAQKKIKKDKHIVTSRLRNSLFVKTPKQKYAKRSTNKRTYSFQGGTGLRFLSVPLKKGEGAFGTNVVYAEKIEELDSFIKFASENVDVDKRYRQAADRAEKKLRGKGNSNEKL
jgi:hypothetical protein